MRNRYPFVFGACLVLLLTQVAEHQSAFAAGAGSSAKKSKRTNKYRYSLVPPPPPVPVSPAVLASYGGHYGASMRFLPSKPRHLAEEMKLTAVVDDVAFFKLHSNEDSIHLKQGNSYQSVKVAQISPETVVLEEKGLQFVKRLQ